MKLTDDQKQAMHDYGIPDYMHDGIARYYEDRIPPGGFLTAVINNDLREACARADDTNRHRLFAYMMWFYNHAPIGSWGHANAVDEWLSGDEQRATA